MAPPVTRSTLLLVRAAQEGDRAALESLYERYLPRLRRWARGRLPGRGRGAMDTEDLVQDVLLRTLHRFDSLRPESGGFFQAYTRRALLNAIQDLSRGARERVPISVALEKQETPGPSPLEAAIGKEAIERYERGLARLEPEERELVVCRLELGMSHEEIAAETDKASPDAARMAVKRAIAKLAREMGDGLR